MRTPFIQAAAALCLSLAVIAGYGWWYAVVSAKSAVAAGLERQIRAKTDIMSRISAARATLKSVAGDTAAVEGYFVPEASVVPFIESLEREGKVLGATVSVLSVSATGPSARPSLAFSLSIVGTFDAVLRTVGVIEYAPYALSVSGLSVAQDAEGAWRADLSFSVGSVPVSRTAPATSATPVTPLFSYVTF